MQACEFKRGDLVWVRGEVYYDAQLDETSVTVRVNGTSVYPATRDVHLIQQFFKAGDKAYFDDSLVEVIHIHEDQAWVKDVSDGTPIVILASALRRKPTQIKEEPVAETHSDVTGDCV